MRYICYLFDVWSHIHTRTHAPVADDRRETIDYLSAVILHPAFGQQNAILCLPGPFTVSKQDFEVQILWDNRLVIGTCHRTWHLILKRSFDFHFCLVGIECLKLENGLEGVTSSTRKTASAVISFNTYWTLVPLMLVFDTGYIYTTLHPQCP